MSGWLPKAQRALAIEHGLWKETTQEKSLVTLIRVFGVIRCLCDDWSWS